MLWAMNTGHEGSLSTCHANSPVDALRRLEVMVLIGRARPAARGRARPAHRRRRPRGAGRPRLATGGGGSPRSPRWSTRPGDGQRIRLLAGPDGLHDLPARPPRRPASRRRTRRGAGERRSAGAGRGRRSCSLVGLPARPPAGRRPRRRRAVGRRRRRPPSSGCAAPDRARPPAARRRDAQLPEALDRLAVRAAGRAAPSARALGRAGRHRPPTRSATDLRPVAPGRCEHGAPRRRRAGARGRSAPTRRADVAPRGGRARARRRRPAARSPEPSTASPPPCASAAAPGRGPCPGHPGPGLGRRARRGAARLRRPGGHHRARRRGVPRHQPVGAGLPGRSALGARRRRGRRGWRRITAEATR